MSGWRVVDERSEGGGCVVGGWWMSGWRVVDEWLEGGGLVVGGR